MVQFDPTTAVVKGTTAATQVGNQNFIPQLWSDEVIAAYKSNLVMANLVRKLNHTGKKGDTIYVPRPTRGTASDKAAATAQAVTTVTPIGYAQQTRITISINKHKEYSRFIEDIVDVQALESLRRFYTDDAGYAIARAVDTDLINKQLEKAFSTLVFDASAPNQIDQTSVVNGSTNLVDGAGVNLSAMQATSYATVSDAGIRSYIRRLDVADVPLAGRSWVVHPDSKEDLTGIPRFTEQAFTGEANRGNTIRNGLIGDAYGVPVFVSNQLPAVEDLNTEDSVLAYMSLFFHQDSTVLVEQMGMRSQRQYLQQYLADLMTTDMIYGVENLRTESIVTAALGSTGAVNSA